MKSFIKFIIDFGPLVVFFVFYKKTGSLIEAIIPLMIATLISILVSYLLEKKIPIMPTVGGIIILIFGGLIWYFKDPIFIKMKPTIINIIFALAIFVGNYFNKPLFKYLLGESIKLEDQGWIELGKRWAYFFIFLAFLNEIIWRNFSEDLWVNFKVFGILFLTFIFSISQFSIIKKFQK